MRTFVMAGVVIEVSSSVMLKLNIYCGGANIKIILYNTLLEALKKI